MYLNMVRKENFQSPNAGANGAIAPVGSRALAKPTDIAVDVANGCQVVETKSFELPNMSEPINPMERPATIGEYYVMQNHLRGHSGSKDYRSSWRDIFIYNEDKDGFTRIPMDVALRHCARFDTDGDLARINFKESGGSDLEVPPDMFLRRNDKDANGTRPYVPTEHMGDIHSMYLRDAGLGDWAESVITKLLLAEPGIARALRDGVELCNKIDAVDSSEGAQNTWFMWLWLMHVLPRVPQQWNDEHGLPYPPTLEDYDSAPGSSFLKLVCQGGKNNTSAMLDTKAGTIKAMPVGYASWPGLCILANPRYKRTFGQHHEIAARFVSAFETLYSTLRQHATDSVFMEGKNAPPWFKARDGRSTLFANLLYVSDAPIWIRISHTKNAVNLPKTRSGSVEYIDNEGTVIDADGMDITKIAKSINLTEIDGIDIGAVLKGPFGKPATGETYSQWLQKVREHIRVNVFGNGKADEEEDPTFGRILDRFVDFFSRSPVSAMSVPAVAPKAATATTAEILGNPDTTMGVYLVQKFLALMESVGNMPQPPAGNDGGETNLYRLAAFVNTGSTATSMKGFVHFMQATHTILTLSTAYYTADNKMEWGTKGRTKVPAPGTAAGTPPVEHLCLRDYIMNEVGEKSGYEYAKVPEYDLGAVGNAGKATIELPPNVIKYEEGEVILPTYLVGGEGLRSIMSRFNSTTKTMAAFGMIVAIDPFGHVPGLDDNFSEVGKRQHYADRIPPLFYTPGASNLSKNYASKPIFGAKRARFGASNERMPPRKGARYAFEEDDEPRDDIEDNVEIDPWNMGGSSAMRDFSESFKQRFREVARAETDMLRRCLKLCFTGLPVNYSTFVRIIANDDVFPFGFLLLRPYITYSMASAILTVGGSGTGETLVGHADFQLADNIVQKMHIGNFTMYLKSVVYQPHHVWIADNIMATGYIGGNNCDFRKPGTSDPPSEASHPSIFSCLVPYDCTQDGTGQGWESELPNPLDITGDYSMGNPALASLRTAVKDTHYATARFYSQTFGWDNSDQNMGDDSTGTNNRYNTLCFSGHYMMYNMQTQRYDLVSMGTGHRGERVYPGCGRVWRGLAKLLEPVNYISSHGGAPLRTMVTNSM